MREVKAYACECGKVYIRKYNCTRHEKTCWKNSENRTCSLCAYFDNDKKSCFHPDPKQRDLAFQKDELTIYKNCESWNQELNVDLFQKSQDDI